MTKDVSENENFVRLIQILQHDNMLRERMIQILMLDSEKRNSMIETMMVEMKKDNVKEDVIEIASYLMDDDIAVAVVDFFEKKDR